jgi:hypothetical protein
MFSVPTTPLTLQTTELCSQAAKQTTERRSLNPHKCYNHIFSYWIFSNSSSIFSYDSVMLAVWTRSADGNLFPLCRSTAFKLTSEQSINKSHSVGSSSRPRGSIREQISLQNTTSFSWEKKSLN